MTRRMSRRELARRQRERRELVAFGARVFIVTFGTLFALACMSTFT